MYDDFKEACYRAIHEMYGGGLVEAVKEWLDVSADGKFGILWGTVDSIYNAFATIGMMLIVAYLIMSLIDKASRQELTLEVFAKSIALFVLCFFVIVHGMDIIFGAIHIGNSFLDLMEDAFIVAGDTGTNEIVTKLEAEVDAVEDGLFGMSMVLFYFKNYMISELIYSLEKILIIVACLSRAIEIIVYSMFFPIGVSDMFNNGANSQGFRYIKKLVVLCIEGAIIIAIIMSANLIQGALITSDTGSLSGTAYSLATMTVCVMLIFKAVQYGNDIVGV